MLKSKGLYLINLQGSNLHSPIFVNAVAKKFARNSFWPAGDDIARFLFYFAFFIFFVILVPLNLDVKEIGNLANIGLVFIMAIATTSGTLLLLRFVLSHVDSRLVDPGGK